MDDAAPENDRYPFDWLIFADATFAGLSVLIPLPIVDSIFEWFFRRRMARSIARRRRYPIGQTALQELERSGCDPAGCLLWPLRQTIKLLGKISRKILYFLTIKEATDQLSFYWHRAFLLDHMIRTGHLDESGPLPVGRRALERTLAETPTGPLEQLAAQIVGNTHHALRTLWRVLRRRQVAMIEDHRQVLGQRWDEYQDYWRKLAQRYEAHYAEELAAHQTFLALKAAAAAA